jgi:hypothetical protein
MKKLITIILLFVSVSFSFSQENQEFAQLMLDTEMSELLIKDLDQSIREKDQVLVCRIDVPTKRVFILSKPGEVISESMVTSWFLEKNASIRCFYKGIYKLDPVKKFPFQNCDQ